MDFVTLNDIVYILFISSFSLIGASCNDVYDTLTEKELEMNVKRIVVGGITGAIVLGGLSELIPYFSNLEGASLIFFSFISGVTGFKTFGSLKQFNLLKKSGLTEEFVKEDESDEERKQE